MDQLLFPTAAFFLSVLGYLQLQGHISLQKSFKSGCLWVSQSHRILGAGNGSLEIIQSSPSCQGRVRFGVDQALLPSLV